MLTKSVARRLEPIYIYVDGGCKGNHRQGNREAYGSFAVYHNNELKRHEVLEFPDASSNNEAEFLAMMEVAKYITGLLKRAENLPDVVVYSDSELVVMGLNGQKKVKASNLKPYCDELKQWMLLRPFVSISWIDNLSMKKVLGH